MSFRSLVPLFVLCMIIVLFVIPCPVNGNDSVPDISSVAVPLKAPLSLSSSSSSSDRESGRWMIERLEKKIQAEANHEDNRQNNDEKMIITAAVANDEETIEPNNNEKKPAEAPNNTNAQSTNTANPTKSSTNANEKKPEDIEHRELGAGRAIVNAVWFIVIITVIPCLLCTCLLSCLCYMMEWIPNPFSGEYYSAGPHGGSGIWGTGTGTGTGWYGPGSTA